MSDPELNKAIGERLRHYFCEYLSLTEKRAGQLLDLTPSNPQAAFNMLARGQRTPQPKLLVRCNRLGVSIDWLLTGEGRMQTEKARKGRPPAPK